MLDTFRIAVSSMKPNLTLSLRNKRISFTSHITTSF